MRGHGGTRPTERAHEYPITDRKGPWGGTGASDDPPWGCRGGESVGTVPLGPEGGTGGHGNPNPG